MARAMANELFTYERVEAEQCIMGKFYDVPSPSAAEEWAVALRARIMTGVQECYDEEGVDPPALVLPLLMHTLQLSRPDNLDELLPVPNECVSATAAARAATPFAATIASFTTIAATNLGRGVSLVQISPRAATSRAT